MKYRFSRPWMRSCALLLAAVCLAGVFFCGVTALTCLDYGFLYGGPAVYQTSRQCAQNVRNQGWEVIDQFRRNPEFPHWDRMLEHTNLRFIILQEQTGDVAASYLEGLGLEAPDNLADNIFYYQYDTVMSKGEYGSVLEDHYVCDFYFGENWAGDSSCGQMGQEDAVSYQILYVLGEHIDAYCGDGIGSGYRLFLYFRDMSVNILFYLLLSALPLMLLVLYLLVTAGRKPGEEAPVLHWFDRIPTDLLLAAAGLAGIGIIGLAVWLWETACCNPNLTLSELRLIQSLTTVGAAVCGTVVLRIFCSFSARIKAGTFWQSAVVVRVCRFLGNAAKRIFGGLWRIAVRGVRSAGLVTTAAVDIAAVFLAEFLLLLWTLAANQPLVPVVLLVVGNLALICALLWGAWQMKRLQDAAQALAEGNLEHRLDTDGLYWEFGKHGEHLNAILDGMNKAVEQRMKSERLKTELITNVSHDIKTPLTSIVNYVDLLQKPHTDAEQIQYLEVLDRQARRLKKLTENLMEASKASTGNLPVELAPTRVMELLSQAVEEYRDRLEGCGLKVVLDLRGDLTVMADGKHMWRILDNLLNNAVKYAMEGTRVYVTARKLDGQVEIAVKNISRDPLNVQAEELMERFVRGDTARTTEGSGLGLSIARSLTVLQKGQFDLTVDGDLFKAQITLPAV